MPPYIKRQPSIYVIVAPQTAERGQQPDRCSLIQYHGMRVGGFGFYYSGVDTLTPLLSCRRRCLSVSTLECWLMTPSAYQGRSSPNMTDGDAPTCMQPEGPRVASKRAAFEQIFEGVFFGMRGIALDHFLS